MQPSLLHASYSVPFSAVGEGVNTCGTYEGEEMGVSGTAMEGVLTWAVDGEPDSLPLFGTPQLMLASERGSSA